MYSNFKLWALSFILICALSTLSLSQNPNEELANQLKKEYKDETFVALETNNEIEFSLNKKTSQPIISERERIKLLTLNDHAQLYYYARYDDNSEVDPSYIAKNMKKKDILGVDKICGNYEVNSIFYSDAKLCTYTVPLSTFASTNEFGVNIQYNDVKYFTKVFFHESFSSLKTTITFIVPDWMDVDFMEMNFDGYKIEKTKTYDAKLKANRYAYTLLKAKKIDNEDNTKGFCQRYPHLLVLSKSYTLNGQKTEVLSTPADLYKWYYGLVKSVDNHDEILKDQVSSLISGKNTDEEKIKAIYYWVQDNIRYIAFENGIAGYKPEPAANVYKNRYGDCKGMANLTKEMLKLAGFDARLTWIGTNNLPYSCKIPSLAINDHMICTVILKDKKYILDATEKFATLDDHAERIQGKDIMIENGDTFIEDKVPIYGKERNLTSIHATLEIDGAALKGQGEMILKGESKKDLLYEVEMTSAKDKDKLLKYMTSKGGDKNLTVEVLKTSDFTQREGDIKIDYSFKVNNYISTFNNEMYIDIDPYKQYKWMKIDSNRQNDFNFGKKILIQDVYKIKIPEGYLLKYLPKGMDKKHEEFGMKISYKEENNEIIFEKEISIDKGFISKSNFKEWNNMLRELIKNYNELIVLVKK